MSEYSPPDNTVEVARYGQHLWGVAMLILLAVVVSLMVLLASRAGW